MSAWWGIVASEGSLGVLGSHALVARVAATAPGTDSDALGYAIIAGMAISAGLLVAWIATTQRLESHDRLAADWLAVGVGPLLSSLGAVAMLTAAGENPGIAGVAGAFGTILAWAVVGATDGADGRGPLVRRGVGGATLAAGYAAGSLVGLLGAAVLAGHVTVETAVGREDGWLRATGVTVCILGVFLAATALGIGALGLSPAGRVAALSFAGGSLLVVGLAETNLTGSQPRNRRIDTS